MNRESRYPVILENFDIDEFCLPGDTAPTCLGWDGRTYRRETLGLEVRLANSNRRPIVALVDIFVDSTLTNKEVDEMIKARPALVPWIWSYGRNEEVPS